MTEYAALPVQKRLEPLTFGFAFPLSTSWIFRASKLMMGMVIENNNLLKMKVVYLTQCRRVCVVDSAWCRCIRVTVGRSARWSTWGA